MDWNWFFSSLAQSTAAIVGLIGAFVFTKVVNNEATRDADADRLRELLRDGEGLREELSHRSFEWYSERRREAGLRELRRLYEDQDEPVTDPELYFAYISFSPFDDPDELMEAIESEIEEAESLRRHSTVGYMGFDPSAIVPLTVQQQTLAEEERIRALWMRTSDHLRRSIEFVSRARTDPHRSVAIRWTLVLMAALFLVGVIYPLGLLPAPAGGLRLSLGAVLADLGTFRWWLLAFVTALFGAVVGWLGWVNETLKVDPDRLAELAAFGEHGDYSDHFATAFEHLTRVEAPVTRILP